MTLAKLDSLPVELKLERHLLYFEGPLVSLMRAPSGEAYLDIFADYDEKNGEERILFRTKERAVLAYQAELVTLRSLLLECADGFAFQTTRLQGKNTNVRLISVREIPDRLLPEEDSYWCEDLQPANHGVTEQGALLDGTWTVNELSVLEKRYRQVYSFLSVTQRGVADNLRNLNSAFKNHTFRSGYNFYAAFEKILMSLPSEVRPETTAFQYASPGFLKFRVDPDRAASVRGALTTLRRGREAMLSSYNRVHGLVVEYQRPETTEGRKASIEKQLDKPVRTLATELAVKHELLLAMTINNAQGAFLLCSYYRKLEELLRFEEAGRVHISNDREDPEDCDERD